MTFGTIFDVKRFALYDGQGIRSTLFLKGCPLSCPWCQNPEGLSEKISLHWTSSKCIRCGQCITVCPNRALFREETKLDIKIDHVECDSTGLCIDECPTAALSFDGQRVSAGEIVDEILRDRDFFDNSGGGITLSGGEPLVQISFALEVLRLCKEAGVHTAVETTLAASHATVASFMPYTDLFLVDQKIADPELHRRILKVPLEPIRKNLEFLFAEDAEVSIRIPLIPGFTATVENLRGFGAYIATLEHMPWVELLNFNPLAENKYRLLNHNWPIPKGTPRYTREEMEGFADILRNTGVERVCCDN